MHELQLLPHEKTGTTWLRVKAYAETRIAKLRLRLEADLNPHETTKVRTQIKELRYLLSQETGLTSGTDGESEDALSE